MQNATRDAAAGTSPPVKEDLLLASLPVPLIWAISVAAALFCILLIFWFLRYRRSQRRKINSDYFQSSVIKTGKGYKKMSDDIKVLWEGKTIKKSDPMPQNDFKPLIRVTAQTHTKQKQSVASTSSSEIDFESKMNISATGSTVHDFKNITKAIKCDTPQELKKYQSWEPKSNTEIEVISEMELLEVKPKASGSYSVCETASLKSDLSYDGAKCLARPKITQRNLCYPGNQVSSPDGNTICRIKYRLDYDFDKRKLGVAVIEARNLPSLVIGGTSDPFVEVSLLPDNQRFQTRVLYGTQDPVFNEMFYFENLPYDELTKKTLVLTAFDHDAYSRDEAIGVVEIKMGNIDFAYDQKYWSELVPPSPEKKNNLGKICFSLKYTPTSGNLSVVILEAKNLPKMDFAGLSDPYVKVSLMKDGKRLKKKKTSVKKKTLNPYYNETLSFDVPYEITKKVSLVISVIDHDRFSRSDPIGAVIIGPNEYGIRFQHWAEMMANARKSVSLWHNLQQIKKKKK